MEHGSFVNMVYDRSAPPEPEVGMGATILMWSDRYAATVVEVRRFKSGQRAGQVAAVKVQEDKATRTDGHGMSDSQSYSYEPAPDGPVREFKVSRDGRFKGLLVGKRDHHHDYSF